MRVSLRLGARRSTASTAHHAEPAAPRRSTTREEGIEFHWLTSPLELLGDKDNNVRGMRCQRMELGEPTTRAAGAPCGRGSEFEFETDMVSSPSAQRNPIIGQTRGSSSTSGLHRDRRQPPDLDSGVFAGATSSPAAT